MHQRFFKNAAIKLAAKLRELGQQKSSTSNGNNGNGNNNNNTTNNENAAKIQSTSADKKYIELFNLPADEVLIQGRYIYKYHGII